MLPASAAASAAVSAFTKGVGSRRKKPVSAALVSSLPSYTYPGKRPREQDDPRASLHQMLRPCPWGLANRVCGFAQLWRDNTLPRCQLYVSKMILLISYCDLMQRLSQQTHHRSTPGAGVNAPARPSGEILHLVLASAPSKSFVIFSLVFEFFG